MKTCDYYGKELKTDTKVAFNYSGELRMGTITEIKSVTRHGRTESWGHEPLIEIRVKHCDGNQISKITNRKNVVVI